MKNHKLPVDILALLLGINSWLSSSPIFSQSPLLVHVTPEGWTLPSYLEVIYNSANIGIIFYSLKQRCFPNAIKDTMLIYFFMFAGCSALIILTFFYNHTMTVFGESHSMALFVINFFTSYIGCTSAVLFIPFMNNFPEVYLISYMVGEGLSVLIPSAVSLIQGVGQNYCENVTLDTGKNITIEHTYPAKFSSEIFFSIMFMIMVITSITFVLLNNSKTVTTERDNYLRNKELKPELQTDSNNTQERLSLLSKLSMMSYSHSVLLVIETFVLMILYSILASIEPYSALPYGNVVYLLAVHISRAAKPIAYFLMFFIPTKRLPTIFFLTGITVVGVTYQVVIAALSPTPPLQNTNIGGIIVVCIYFISL